MPDLYSVSILNDRNLIRNFEQLPDIVKQLLFLKVESWLDQLEGKVKENIRDRLQQKSGRLLAAVDHTVSSDGDRIEGYVTIEGVPYAKAQDTGADIAAHIIRPKNARVLRFIMNGQKAYAQYVFHPGAHIPGTRYAKDAYSEMGPQISKELKTTIVQGIRQHMRSQ